MTDTGALNLRAAETLVRGLAGAGLRHAVVCPGSRSTPLAVALHRHPDIRVWMHVDERSAAYFGLGIARRTGEPVALLCSSGTAAANFLPAVVEANLSQVPLVVLTADRPPEFRDVGAAQTVDQVRLYGGNVRWFVDLPPPDPDPLCLRHAATTAARAMSVAHAVPKGPVHLNVPFREPLLPAGPLSPVVEPVPAAVQATAPASIGAPDPVVRDIADTMTRHRRGIIVCGPQPDRGLSGAVADFAAKTNWPILADPLSQVRCGPHDRSHVIDAYDAFLRNADVADQLRPDIVVRIGAIPTSKPLNGFLDRLGDVPTVLVTASDRWSDPWFRGSVVVTGDPARTVAAIADTLETPAEPGGGWFAQWREANAAARAGIACALSGGARFEGDVFRDLASVLPGGATLVVGSSMPVRDLDTFLPPSERDWTIVANRGANGIDGVVSTALGAAAVANGPTLLVVGDLSFFHDMNGLLAAKLHAIDVTILVVNNDGGGIFSFLPQAASLDDATFEHLFGTPTGLDIGHVARLYDAGHSVPAEPRALAATLTRTLSAKGLHIVEYRTDRQANVEQHRACWRAVDAALRQEAIGVVG